MKHSAAIFGIEVEDSPRQKSVESPGKLRVRLLRLVRKIRVMKHFKNKSPRTERFGCQVRKYLGERMTRLRAGMALARTEVLGSGTAESLVYQGPSYPKGIYKSSPTPSLCSRLSLNDLRIREV